MQGLNETPRTRNVDLAEVLDLPSLYTKHMTNTCHENWAAISMLLVLPGTRSMLDITERLESAGVKGYA